MRAMLWIILCCAALLILLGLGCDIYSRQITAPYQQQLAQIANLISQEYWQQAALLSQKAENEWQRHAPLLSLWSHHEDVDSVAAGFSQLTIALKEEKRMEALLFVRELEKALSMVYDRDAFALKNIL